MQIQFEILEKMQEFEEIFLEELQNNQVILLRDIKVTKEQLSDIAKNIRQIYASRNIKVLEEKFPLTTSLFLVWISVYDYNDGELWSKIFDSLKIPKSIKNQNIFGNIFLKTIKSFGLQPVISTDSKKYLSPILMHGYISDFYSKGLFDYLNKVYTLILDGDVSESFIGNIWGDIFNENNRYFGLNAEISDLKKTIKHMEDKKVKYSITEDLLLLDRKEVENLEKYIEDILNEIKSEEEKISVAQISYKKLQQALQYQIEFQASIDRIQGINSNILNNDEKNQIGELSSELKRTIGSQILEVSGKINESSKFIKNYRNVLMIQEEKLKNLYMVIATIGKGDLEEGWLTLDDFKDLDSEINNLRRALNNKEKLSQLSSGFQNTSLNQILTSSLSHLHKSNPDFFKAFIIRTFQMMNAVFKGTEIDRTHPLYDTFIEWFESYDNRKIGTSLTNVEGISDVEDDDSQPKGTGKKNKDMSRRLQLQRLSKPYLSLNTNSGALSLNIPEQLFDIKTLDNKRPRYILEDGEGIIVEHEPSIIFRDGKVHINELRIPINKFSEQRFLFNWYNLRESHSIDLESIMIFDDEGKIVNTDRLNNGFYYVVCDDNWFTKFDGVIDITNAGIKGYKVYELQLNENRAAFLSRNGNSFIELVGSDFYSVELNNLKIVDGITLDGVKVATGTMPDLVIGLRDINPQDYTLKVFVDETLLHNMWLHDVINSKVSKDFGLSTIIDLSKLIKLRREILISRLKIVIEKINGITIFEEEFYLVLKTKFLYKNRGLSVEIAPGMRFNHNSYIQNSMEYLIPLLDENGEKFDIYFERIGWKTFIVEVPKIKMTITDNKGNIIDNSPNLLVSEIHKIKDYNITWETKSKIPKTIMLYDSNRGLESRLHFKRGKVVTSLNPYYDIFIETNSNNSLIYHWEGGNRVVDSITIFNVYEKWNINDINVFQKEEDDEFILELKLEENFSFNGQKKLRIISENIIILEKKLAENQVYIYIKKKDIKSLNINIEIIYLEKFNDIFGEGIKEVIAGQKEVKLLSKISEINTILSNGIIAKGFRYEGSNYNFKNPFIIDNVIKAAPINFIKEELYMGSARINSETIKVLFYINLERKVLPFLLDLDRDGVQYHPETGEVFWESRIDKKVMGPIEDIKYTVKEE